MTGLRYSPLHVTEFCGEMQGKFKVGLARLITLSHEEVCRVPKNSLTDPKIMSPVKIPARGLCRFLN